MFLPVSFCWLVGLTAGSHKTYRMMSLGLGETPLSFGADQHKRDGSKNLSLTFFFKHFLLISQ